MENIGPLWHVLQLRQSFPFPFFPIDGVELFRFITEMESSRFFYNFCQLQKDDILTLQSQ